MADKLGKSLRQQSFDQILEIGCGTGYYTNLLAHQFSTAQIISFDISEKMLEIAKERIDRKRVWLLAADAEKLYFNKHFRNRWELITSNACLQWIRDFKGLARLSYVYLAFGGSISFSTFGPETLGDVSHILTEVLGNTISLPAQTFIDKQKLHAILAEQGFDTLNIEEERKEELYPSVIELLRTIKYSSGGGSPGANKIVFTKKIMNELESAYIKEFGHIKATYQLFYCEARK